MTASSPNPVTSSSVLAARASILGEGAPADPAAGMQRLRAAAAGEAEAARTLATLTAAGAWTPQSWPEALDHLQHAAELGDASAQGQLSLLGRGSAHDWAALRRAIRVEDWQAAPERRNLCEQPRVRQCDRFASPAVCDWLIGLARGRLKPAMMVEGYGAPPRPTEARTNSDFAFTVFDADCVLALVRERISALLRLPVAAMEPPQVFHYAVGQELKPHVDYLQREGRAAGPYAGDRIATFLLYLNDDFEGGETSFPRVGLKARPAKGGALYFANVDAANRPEPMSLHAGLAPTQGEKWLLSQWVHDRPFRG